MPTSRPRDPLAPRRQRPGALALAPALLAGLLAACTPPTPGSRDSARIQDWLTCYECTGGELDSIHALVQLRRDSVRTLLSRELLHGPAPAVRLTLRRRFERTFQVLHPTPGGMAADRDLFVSRYLRRFVDGYRLRAGRALAFVGGADSVLLRAAGNDLPVPGDTVGPALAADLLAQRDSVVPWPP